MGNTFNFAKWLRSSRSHLQAKSCYPTLQFSFLPWSLGRRKAAKGWGEWDTSCWDSGRFFTTKTEIKTVLKNKTKKLKSDKNRFLVGLEGSHGRFASSKDQRWTHSQVLGRTWGHWKARTRQRVALQECQEGIINYIANSVQSNTYVSQTFYFNAIMVAGVVGHYPFVEFWSQKAWVFSQNALVFSPRAPGFFSKT